MRTLSALTAGTLLLSALGCREESAAPTEPESTSTAAVAAVTSTPAFTQVVVNGYTTCGLGTGQRAWCWGNNGVSGALGTGSTHFFHSTTPLAVTGGATPPPPTPPGGTTTGRRP